MFSSSHRFSDGSFSIQKATRVAWLKIYYIHFETEQVEEKELTDGAKPLIAEVERLLSDKGEKVRAEMSEKIRQFAVPDANRLIYNDLCELVKNHKKK